jgi:2-alkenal reductase
VIQDLTDLEVNFPSGYKARGEVVGTDLDSDIAVVRVEAPAGELHPLTFSDSDTLKVGQAVIAIGNPFGFDGSMTLGIISALGRAMESLHTSPTGQFFSAGDIIQTDAAINPGNSGGPLLNLNGEVIGVNRAIFTDSFSESGQPVNSGIGFAISINVVKRVMPALISSGHYDYPYVGISSLNEITLLVQEALDLPQATGVYVTDVTSGGPAEQAGLRWQPPYHTPGYPCGRRPDHRNRPNGGEIFCRLHQLSAAQ